METQDPNSVNSTTTPTAAKQKILGICYKYFELSMLCSHSPDIYKEFLSNPIPFLTTGYDDGKGVYFEGCGMMLPPNTKVMFDRSIAWPTIYLLPNDSIKKYKDADNTYAAENPLEVNTNYNITSFGNKSLSSFASVNFGYMENPTDYTILLIMPNFVPDYDELIQITFSGNESVNPSPGKQPDIILTSC